MVKYVLNNRKSCFLFDNKRVVFQFRTYFSAFFCTPYPYKIWIRLIFQPAVSPAKTK